MLNPTDLHRNNEVGLQIIENLNLILFLTFEHHFTIFYFTEADIPSAVGHLNNQNGIPLQLTCGTIK